MTLISGLHINGCPILFGDLLISGSGTDFQKIGFPTKNALNSPPRFTDLGPVSLCQKVNLLSPKLAIAWAGNLAEATTFINQVVCSGLHNSPSRKELIEIFNDLDKPETLSFIGLIKKPDCIETFWKNAKYFTNYNSEISNLIVAGSGENSLRDLLSKPIQTNHTGTPNRLELAIGTTINLFASLFTSEITESATIQKFFGCGYELVHPINDHFEKFSDVTYVFWKIFVQNGSICGCICPYLAMKYSYLNNFLIIRSVSFIDGNSYNDEIHIIKPIFWNRSPDLSLLRPESLNSRYICSVFETIVNGDLFMFSQTGRFQNNYRPIIFCENNGEITGVDINKEYFNNLLQKFIQGS